LQKQFDPINNDKQIVQIMNITQFPIFQGMKHKNADAMTRPPFVTIKESSSQIYEKEKTPNNKNKIGIKIRNTRHIPSTWHRTPPLLQNNSEEILI